MVLDRSDYNISNLWRGNWDPTSPVNFGTKLAGALVALTAVLWAFNWARNQGVPIMNRVTAFLSGGRVSTESPPRVF